MSAQFEVLMARIRELETELEPLPREREKT